MDSVTIKALGNAAESSAMEGQPLSQEDTLIIQRIMDGEKSLQEYARSLTEER